MWEDPEAYVNEMLPADSPVGPAVGSAPTVLESLPEPTEATPVAPAPVAGPKAAEPPAPMEGGIPVKHNGVLVGHMDPMTNEIKALPGMEEQVDRVNSRRATMERQSSRIMRNAAAVERVAPQGADNLVQQTNETKMAEEERQAKQAAQPPVVVSAPSQTTIQQTSNTSVRNPARNTESSLSRYNMGRFTYVPM